MKTLSEIILPKDLFDMLGKKCVFDDNPAMDEVWLDEPNQPLCGEHLASLEKMQDTDEARSQGN